MEVIELKFNVDPIGKARPRVTRNGTYTPKKTKDFQNAIKDLARLQYQALPLAGALEVDLIFEIERPKSVKRKHHTVKCDLDNYIKAVLDALNGVIYKDDAQIIKISAIKKYDPAGSIKIRVGAL